VVAAEDLVHTDRVGEAALQRRDSRRLVRVVLSQPILLAALVGAAYVGQARQVAAHPARFDYVRMDAPDVANGYGHSPAIDRAVREGPVRRYGYDGQFFYFIALDPVGAAPYLGDPSYRYSRIGYPLVARAVALGDPSRVREALVLVNGLAIALATFLLASILVRWGESCWWSLLLATYPGLMLSAFVRDTPEPLAVALALGGTWVLTGTRRLTGRRAAAAGLLFAAGALTRETALLFALPAAAALIRERRPALILAATSLLPYLAWRAFLVDHYGGLGGEHLLSALPFAGLFEARPWNADRWLVVFSVIVPVLVALGFTARRAFVRASPLVAYVVIANCLLIVFAGSAVFDGYGSTGRVASGAAAATFLAFPALRRTWGSGAAIAAVGLWSLPYWLLVDVPARLLGS
jgi:hypothetical protein